MRWPKLGRHPVKAARIAASDGQLVIAGRFYPKRLKIPERRVIVTRSARGRLITCLSVSGTVWGSDRATA